MVGAAMRRTQHRAAHAVARGAGRRRPLKRIWMAHLRRGQRHGAGKSLLAGLLLATAGPVAAASAQAMLSSPIDIAFCLCLQRDIATRQDEMAIRRNAYEGSVREIQDAEAALERD